jgi:hypothetical protein
LNKFVSGHNGEKQKASHKGKRQIAKGKRQKVGTLFFLLLLPSVVLGTFGNLNKNGFASE